MPERQAIEFPEFVGRRAGIRGSRVLNAIWYPALTTEVTVEDHLWRIVLVFIALVMAYLVHRLYRKRLRENADYVHMQAVQTAIAARLASGKVEDYPHLMDSVLRMANDYLAPTRVWILESVIRTSPEMTTLEALLPPAILTDTPLSQAAADWVLRLARDGGQQDHCVSRRLLIDHENKAQALEVFGTNHDYLTVFPLPARGRISALVLLEKQNARSHVVQDRQDAFLSTLSSALASFI